jgi:hypothetical protein
MARTGDRFEMPDGSVYAVTSAAGDTGGEFVGMEFTLPPGSIPPPAHVHPLARIGRLLGLRTTV